MQKGRPFANYRYIFTVFIFEQLAIANFIVKFNSFTILIENLVVIYKIEINS